MGSNSEISCSGSKLPQTKSLSSSINLQPLLSSLANISDALSRLGIFLELASLSTYIDLPS